MTRCIACLQGFTWECEHGGCTNSVADNSEYNADSSDNNTSNGSTNYDSDIWVSGELSEDVGKAGRVVNGHNDGNLKDQQSTGRKRAAVMYPLDREADCEWKMRKSCGGGPKPITGCINGKQEARHHGPDKNTLNNDEGNVHRICHVCHNRWHTENDSVYVWGIIQNPHRPRTAVMQEMAENEVYWAGRKLVKAKD